jgi:predicted CoA-binding protein
VVLLGIGEEVTMPSKHEEFWLNDKFVVIGNSAVKPFPVLTFNALKQSPEKTVYAVDPSCGEIEGENAFDDLASLPEPVDAAVIETPREETAAWVGKIADAGIKSIWIHMGRETAEALSLAEEKGLSVCSGTCAVQYVSGSFPHNIHRFLRKLTGNW